MRVDQVLDKGVGKMNEDALLVGKYRFGVFDGASSLDDYTDEEGRTGGYLAASIAKETFEHSDAGVVETAMEANRKIREAMTAKKLDVGRKETRWCSTAAVIDIDISNKTFKWAQIADALILIIKNDGTFRILIEDDYDHDREVMVLWKQMADTQTDDIRSRLHSKIVELRRAANVKYGVLNGDPNAARFLRASSGSLEDIAHVLLFTDGMIPPKEDPSAPDDLSGLVHWYLEGGLSNVRDRIREIEASDPNCWKYPRYKKSDDIAAIAIKID